MQRRLAGMPCTAAVPQQAATLMDAPGAAPTARFGVASNVETAVRQVLKGTCFELIEEFGG
jgi:hypothetical protein